MVLETSRWVVEPQCSHCSSLEKAMAEITAACVRRDLPASNPLGWGSLLFTDVKPQPAFGLPAPFTR